MLGAVLSNETKAPKPNSKGLVRLLHRNRYVDHGSQTVDFILDSYLDEKLTTFPLTKLRVDYNSLI